MMKLGHQQKSSRCNSGNCAHAGIFHTPSRSGGTGCVGVDVNDYEIRVSDTKDPDGPVLHYTPAEWLAFIRGVRDGEFDLPPQLQAQAEAKLAETSIL